MPNGNYDASRVTQRNRAIALYTFNAANNDGINTKTSVRREQPNTQLGEVLAHRHTTNAYSTDSTQNTLGCACTKEVVNNAGGNNSNNVE